MGRSSRSLALLLGAALCTTPMLAQQGGQNQEETDDATARWKAFDEWYNENYGTSKGKKGGPWKADYRKFMLDAAAREKATLGLAPTGGLLAPVTGSSWINLGPTRSDFIRNGSTQLTQIDSGRIRSIVIDPANISRIFVATAGGGVWRTTDGGTTWTPITESLGTLAIGSLAMDPSDSNVLYLGLGDPFDGTGVGIVKSIDGGTTWSAPITLGTSTAIPQVFAVNSSTILVATNQGLYRSTNSGASYSLVNIATGQAELPYVWSIAKTGATSLVLTLEALSSAASGSTLGQSWYSSDSGATWIQSTGFTSAAGIGRATVASSPSTPNIVYAMAAIPNSASASDLSDMFRSTNGGQTWTALSAANKRYSNRNRESASVGTLLNGQGWYNHVVIVSPTNSNTVFFGGALLMAKTTDGGSTFSQVSNWLAQFSLPYIHADFHAAAFANANTMYVGTDGGLFKSTDGGVTWSSSLNQGLVTHLLYSSCSTPLSSSLVLGGLQDNGTRIRAGATSTFNQVIGGDGFACNAHQTVANSLLGSLYNARIQKSTNGGSTWAQSCTGITECGSSSAPFFTKIAAWAGNNNTVFTIANTRAYRSVNYAGSWTALGATGLPTSGLVLRNINVAATNANIIGLVANSGRVYLSTNGGTSWTERPAATLPGNGFSLSHIHFDSTNASTIYVASVAPVATANHLWKSTDGGTTWAAIDGSAAVSNGLPFGVPINYITNDPGAAGTLFVGTHLGVYRSTDGGATWARFGSGLPLVNVTDVYISPDSTLVRAATYGRGFWQLQ